MIVCINPNIINKLDQFHPVFHPPPSQDGIAMGTGPSHRMAADGALLIYNVGPEAQGRWGTYDL